MESEFHIDRKKISENTDAAIMYASLSNISKSRIYFTDGNEEESESEELGNKESWQTILQGPVSVKVTYLGLGSITSLGRWKEANISDEDKTTNSPITLYFIEGTADIDGHAVKFDVTTSTDPKL